MGKYPTREEYLEHYGIKGMEWGKKKAKVNIPEVNTTRRKKTSTPPAGSLLSNAYKMGQSYDRRNSDLLDEYSKKLKTARNMYGEKSKEFKAAQKAYEAIKKKYLENAKKSQNIDDVTAQTTKQALRGFSDTKDNSPMPPRPKIQVEKPSKKPTQSIVDIPVSAAKPTPKQQAKVDTFLKTKMNKQVK